MVLINAFSAKTGGGLTYLRQLLLALDTTQRQAIRLLVTHKNKESYKDTGVMVIVSKWAGISLLLQGITEQIWVPFFIKKTKIGIFFAPSGLLPAIKIKSCKYVVTFQNMLPFSPVERRRYPLGYIRARLKLLQLLYVNSFKRADCIIFISNFAKQQILAKIADLGALSFVIPHGLDESFRKRYVAKPERFTHEFVLYVSIFDVYKAQVEVVQAWAHLKKIRKNTSEKMMFIGNTRTMYAKKVLSTIQQLHLEDDIVIKGFVPYEELPEYYASAKVNVFASSCENCPNILIEALGAGRPVISSNYDPMPEFAEDAAMYFNPYKPMELAEVLKKILDDSSLQIEYGNKAFEQSKLFSWKNSTDKTWDVFSSLDKDA